MIENIKSPKKLIEVALPLDAINAACAYEKMPGIGAHPRGIHLWWARRPLAAARAVIFAQLVNDPGFQQGNGFKYGKNKKEAEEERERLFKLIEELVKWENTDNEDVLERARVEIRRSWREVCELNKNHPQAKTLFNPEELPALHDPFAGGGAIPLEAQRMGLEVYASDLNPVAVLINKAMIEFPPMFINQQPIGPKIDTDNNTILRDDDVTFWTGLKGLAEDIKRYGKWIHEEAQKRIGNLYPSVEVTSEMAKDRPDLIPLIGKKLKVIAWLWTRTVTSPNPAFSHVKVPLSSTFVLSSNAGKESYVQPVVDGDKYHFMVKDGNPPISAKKGTKLGRGANFQCLLSNTPIEPDYIKAEGLANRIGTKLMAVVVEGPRRRLYLSPIAEMEDIANEAVPNWRPELALPNDARNFWTVNYGLATYGDLFTPRQLVALNTILELIDEVRSIIKKDAIDAGILDDFVHLEDGGKGATAYSEAISVYLAFALDRCTDFCNAVCGWNPSNQKVMHLFGKQTIPMTWDFPEAAILSNTVGGFMPAVEYISDCLLKLSPNNQGRAQQVDAQTQKISENKIISTDPPYYDNIAYADLSDFFYVWLRKALRSVFPNIFSTMAVPKTEELVATPYRHGGKESAEVFFLEGMTKAINNLSMQAHPAFPVTIYYAFKQSETSDVNGTSSTGWETFLSAIYHSGFSIEGTWPLRSEQEYRSTSMGTNALASSIVLVCRKRPANAPTISRREFLRELNQILPTALHEMISGAGDERSPVAPVDLSQAIIGPGMAVFSMYSAVLEADGSPMNVRTALQLINRFLAGDDFDADTQFCLDWFDQYGWKEGNYGEADVLARSKTTSVNGIADAGVLESGGGYVRLRKWAEYPADWDPRTDKRLPVWEVLHQLIRALKQDGESGAGRMLAVVKGKSEAVRQLAYRLYTLCERKGWAEDARAYNELITSWSGIESATGDEEPIQGVLFE